MPWACSRHFAHAAVHVPALAVHLRAVGVRELDEVMVEDLTVFLAGANLPAAHALGLDRMLVAAEPVADVQIVNVLLDDVVAAEPREVVPIVDLVFHFGRLVAMRGGEVGMRADPQAAAVPIHAGEQDVAERAVVNLLHRFDVSRIVTPLQTDRDHEVFLLRLLVGRHEAAHARAVDRDRLLRKDMLVRPSRPLRSESAESRAASPG